MDALNWRKKLTSAFLLGVLLSTLSGAMPARAEGESPTAPHRITHVKVDYIRYKWWIIRWSTNVIMCQVVTDHEGLPTSADILKSCGKEIHMNWAATSSCPQLSQGESVAKCNGVYLFLAGSESATRELDIELPLPKVWLSVDGCDFSAAQSRCQNTPTLVLRGEEPLPNESIISINGVINGRAFSCGGSTCTVPVQPTGMQGADLVFWADSTFGDSSQHFQAKIRAVPWGDFMDPEGGAPDPQLWYVDILSDQWRGGTPASCADSWQVFPAVGGPPQWLSSPQHAPLQETGASYYYLAAMLIRNGAVDANSCPNGGLETDTTANTCGQQAARKEVTIWQNMFNQQIMSVSTETGVPAQLMKNIFGRESQFWPGIYKTYQEAGLGHLTENGADTALLWNPKFFAQFCPLVLSNETCSHGFNDLSKDHQNMLRGALVQKVNASCAGCTTGVDLTQANFSVKIFAETLLGNCEQTGQIIYNTTRRSPGAVSSYVDLWKFTLINYTAGAGCLANAVGEAWGRGDSLDWQHVSHYLEPACAPARQYVEEISTIINPVPTLVPTSAGTITPGPSPTPTFNLQVRPTATPQQTATETIAP